jgi:hypothetical protein
MEKRRKQRKKRRITCEVMVDGKSCQGIVKDHSPTGIFIQTRARAMPNSVVELVFRGGDPDGEIRCEAGVARKRIAPNGLQSHTPGGIGLELLNPPPELTALLEGNLPKSGSQESAGDGGSTAPVSKTFRVRLKEKAQSNFKVLTVRGENSQAARSRALARAGTGWIVADVQEL